MPMRRMDAEQLNDSILAATGQLNPEAFGAPVLVKKESEGEVVPQGTGAGISAEHLLPAATNDSGYFA